MNDDINKLNDFDFDYCLNSIENNNFLEIEKSFWQTNDKFQVGVSTEKHRYGLSFINRFTDSIDKVIIICVKDNPNILKFCLEKIKENNLNKICDLLIVDDRPSTEENKKLAENYECSYLKIVNDVDIFNYSNLNNIAISYCKLFNKKTAICWNSDMWTSSEQSLKNILDLHEKNKSSVTGTRLVYPSRKEYETIFENYDHVLGHSIEKAYNTIQHGGIIFIPSESIIRKSGLSYMPYHQWRFWDKDFYLAKENIKCTAVTGALHVLNINDFIEIKGYNKSLASSFQDIDLCQRIIENNKIVLYVGSEYMYHAETITSNAEGNLKKPTMISDRILYEYLWWGNPMRLKNILGIEKL